MINELSIIFPLFNEEKRIKKTFSEIKEFKKKVKERKVEIIFISDGSTDKSNLLVDEFINKESSKNFFIKFYKLKKNMGKGYALKVGVKKSSLNWILTTDIDLSVPLSQIFVWEKNNKLKFNKVVFGSRNHKKSKVNKNFFRFLLGKIFNFLVINILKIRLLDTQCGFKLYKKSIAKKIFAKLTNYGFSHDLELALILIEKKIKIIEFPVRWVHKKGSKINIFFEPIKMFLNILFLKLKYFLKKI